LPQFATLGDSGWFAGGGGGAIYNNGQSRTYGGRGGGGNGGWSANSGRGNYSGTAGTANTGGGGGGGADVGTGNTGGTGIVVVDYSPRVSAVLPTDGFYHLSGTASDAKGVNVTAYNLLGNITVFAPTGYEVSATSGGTYAATLNLTPSSGEVNTTFFVRIAASTLASTPTGTLTLSTAGLANSFVDLNAFRRVFTNVGTNNFTMPSHVTKVDLLVVGGGGGGGADMGGGGGGGGVIYRQDYDVLPGTQYAAVVGAGGRGAAPHPVPLEISAAQSGGNSVFGNGSATITAIGGFWMSPGILRERMHLFVAHDLVAGPQALEPGERIRPRVVAWAEAMAMCRDGRIEDAKTIAGLLVTDARRRARPPAGR
ncbi:MAG: NUDIX hydrolase, partial [Verrucomicrobia bacterium]|nr:NUDIX hydrolase [Verrucomicrobiota bacterium]